jgi:hypothetical protein
MLMASAPAQAPAGANNKVDSFLALVLQARSLDQISRAYERASFSADEAKRIETEVAKPAYQAKLASLKPKLPPVAVNKLEVTKPASQAPARGAGTAPPARSVKARPTAAKLPSAPAISRGELQALTSRPGGGTGARISGVDPSSFGAGRTLEISGSGFGRPRGSVEILHSGRRYVCDLAAWNDTAIRVVVPEYMAAVIGDRARDAVLWVKLAGQSLGPTFPVRLEPPPPSVELPKAVGSVAEIVEMEISTYVEMDGSGSLPRTETFEILQGSQLANGWRIVSSRLARVSGSGRFEYIREPQAGTSDLYQVIRLNTAAFSRLRVASKMVIRGPRGKNYL